MFIATIIGATIVILTVFYAVILFIACIIDTSTNGNMNTVVMMIVTAKTATAESRFAMQRSSCDWRRMATDLL